MYVGNQTPLQNQALLALLWYFLQHCYKCSFLWKTMGLTSKFRKFLFGMIITVYMKYELAPMNMNINFIFYTILPFLKFFKDLTRSYIVCNLQINIKIRELLQTKILNSNIVSEIIWRKIKLGLWVLPIYMHIYSAGLL